MIALGFLNPLLLWALPLCAVPVVIHLLNRRRYQSRRWAAMEFLLQAMKRNRKRLRMEQWLVLLLRVLAVILLVLLVARPRSDGAILSSGSKHHLLLLDDSASMAHRGGAGNSFDQARETVNSICADLIATRPGDRLSLLHATDPRRPLVDSVSVGPELQQRVSSVLAALRIGYGELNVAELLRQADRQARATESAGGNEFYLISDLRHRDWLDDDGQLQPAIAESLGQLPANGEPLQLISVGQPDPANLAVTALRCVSRRAIAGLPSQFEVEVSNHGDRMSAPTELSIEVDARSRVMRSVPPLEPGQSTSLGFSQTFHQLGPHALRATLSADRYATDDQRSLAIELQPASRVLLVDGSPGREARDAETFFLAAALDPGGDRGIDLRVVSADAIAAWPEAEFFGLDQIWLCNLARLQPSQVERLETFVKGGGGLVVTLGDLCELDNYRELWWKDGQGLLPAELTEPAGDLDQPRHLHLKAADHPAFARHAEQMQFMLSTLVLCGRWIEQRPGEQSRVLLTIDHADGPVLLSEARFGEGSVFLLGTSIDAAWNDAPRWPVYPLLCHELVATGARQQDFGGRTLQPDEDFKLELDPGLHRPDVEMRLLGGELLRTVAAAPGEGDRIELSMPFAELESYGLIELRRRRHAGGVDPIIVARNPLLAEGLLQPLQPEALRRRLPVELNDRVVFRQAQSLPTSGISSGNSGLWRYLGMLMLVGMLAETLLAWRFGRH